uniref:Putative methyltransferase n=1 Tax=viral metagenome TaxID=1070528 RepID=A0A6M3IQB5_9ZZZZ
MTIKNSFKNYKGRPFEIKDCSRDELPEFFKQMGYEVGAEIGAYKGAFTEKFCKEGFRMFAIDPWVSYDGAGRTQQRQERQDFLYEHTKRTLAPYDCTIIRKTSMDALSDFKDGSLDFVYIDGDHEFSHIAADLVEWSKKVKPGGIVSGHDYFCTDPGARNLVCHIKPVVDAYTKVFGIHNFYTFGRSKPLNEEAKDDRYLSFFWIKIG